MKLPAASCGVSKGNPPSLSGAMARQVAPKPTRLRYSSFGAFAPPSSVGTELLAKADHPFSPDEAAIF